MDVEKETLKSCLSRQEKEKEVCFFKLVLLPDNQPTNMHQFVPQINWMDFYFLLDLADFSFARHISCLKNFS